MTLPLTERRRLAGFSMIEAVIALVVVGGLIILIALNVQAVRAKSRDATRRADIDAIASQLENCYRNACDGAYPSLPQLTDTSPGGFVATNFSGFGVSHLYDNSNGIVQSSPASAATQYQYATIPAGCTGTSGATPCAGFTLRAYQETDPSHAYVKESLHT